VDGAAWFITAFLAAGMVVFFALSFVPAVARWSALRSAVAIGVPIPARLEHTVSRRLMARQRGGSAGGLAFVVLATIAFQFDLGATDDPRTVVWFIAGSALAGIGSGTAIAALTASSRAAGDEPRVARSNAVTVADYLSPLERIGTRAIVIVAIVAAVCGAVLVPSAASGARAPMVLFAVLAVASLALFEVSSRRIIALPQPAGSTAELVWDDAVRVSSLRDMLAAPVAFGLNSVVLGIAALVQTAVEISPSDGANLLGISTPFALIALTLYSRAAYPQRYFLRRLWPKLRWSDTADEQSPAATDAV